MKKNERKAILEGYKSHSVNNEIEIIRSKKCGCYFCTKTYNARKVTEWEQGDGGRASAICPECGMSTVIGDASGVPLSKDLLKEMHEVFYKDGPKKNEPLSFREYIDRYLSGETPKTKKNEELFLSYCQILATGGDEKAALSLGDFASGASRFHAPDFKLAYSYYSSPVLRFNPEALCAKGRLALAGYGNKRQKMEGYECFSKAAALGSMQAVYLLADCYHYGEPVKKDEDFALHIIIGGMRESYLTMLSNKFRPTCLPEFSYRLAKCAQNGWGIGPDDGFALKYYLIAQFASVVRAVTSGNDTRPPFFKDAEKQIEGLCNNMNAKKGDPLLDVDTFFDTYGDPNLPDDSEKHFTLVSYDKESGELVFEIECAEPGLLIDTANLYCSFNKPKNRWTFTDVAGFTHNGESDFDQVVVTDSGYQLLRYNDGGDDVVIAEITLNPLEEDVIKEGK